MKEKELLTEWVGKSEVHRNELAQFINIDQLVSVPFDLDDIDLEEAQTVLAKRIKKRSQFSKYIEIWKSIAAILLLPILIASFLIVSRMRGKNQLSQNIIQEIIVPHGVQSFITLSDSTQVWLNSESTLKFPTQFNSNSRSVILDGEAYFKVKSDVEHPFVVKANHLEVKALGTEFNVESYEGDSIEAVTLVNGKVAVNLLSSSSSNSICMRSNQRFVLNNNSFNYKLVDTEALDSQLWKNGILVFRDEPLGNVFKRIGRMFNTNIIIKDKSLLNQNYRATFRGESLEEILQLIAKTSPIRYVRITREDDVENLSCTKTIEVYRK